MTKPPRRTERAILASLEAECRQLDADYRRLAGLVERALTDTDGG